LLDWVEKTTGIRPSSTSLNDQINGRGKINPWLLLAVEALADKAEMKARLHCAVDAALHDRFDKTEAPPLPGRLGGLADRFVRLLEEVESATEITRIERMLNIVSQEVVAGKADGAGQ